VSGTALGSEKMVTFPGKDNIAGCASSVKKKMKQSFDYFFFGHW